MLISDVTTSGALPSLEMMIRFSSQRQKILAHNIANAETPYFQPKDVSITDFQRALGRAIDDRRARGSSTGDLDFPETRELDRDDRGRLRLNPRTPSDNVLFHDRNNRDIERMMQDLAENAAAFRTATELYRHQTQLLHSAISGQV